MRAMQAMLWACLLCWSALATGQPLTLAAHATTTPLAPAAQFWYDARADRTLDDWLHAFQQQTSHAAPVQPGAPGFAWVGPAERPLGRRTGALWVAVHLNNPHAPVLRHLVVSPARLEQIDAWLLTGPDTAPLHLGRAGLSVPLMERPLHSNAPAWGVTLPQGSSTVLLRIQSRTTLQPQIELWEPGAHVLEMRQADLQHGLESGALALAALLTLVFALWLREFTWVWYGGSCLSVMVYQTCFAGQAGLWLWPNHPTWTLPALTLSIASTHVCTALFFLSFIPRHHVSTTGRVAALGLAGISLLGLLLSGLIGFHTGIVLQEVAGLALPVALYGLAWRAWRRGDQPARLVLLSFGLLSIASMLRSATLQNWLPSDSWLADGFFPVAAVLTSTVLMLAMADRVRILVRQRALDAQQHQALLEKRIQEATVELVQARDQAQAAAQFKQRFLSRVSHDLRTPLHTLRGHAGLARRALAQLPAPAQPDAAWERLHESMQAMERSGSDILQLSGELLELARGEAGQLCLKTGPVHLPTLIQDVVDTARWLARHQHNTLRTQVEWAVPWVVMDAERVKQVLRNLLTNACAATRNGVITLGGRSATAPNGGLAQVEWWVGDTGCGIAPAALPRIFEPFEQLHDDIATGDAGLGLAIAQQWVRLMGSDITVQSRLGLGSVFSWAMTVPVADASPPTTPAPADTQAPPPNSLPPQYPPLQGHVLLVAPQPEQRQLQDMLHTMGLRVSQADSADAAMATLQAQNAAANHTLGAPPDPVTLLMCHPTVPADDGAALLPWCRQHQPTLAVLAITDTVLAGAPFDAVLCQPVQPHQLHPVLQRLLPPALDWQPLRQLAERGDGLGVDAWIARHRDQLGDSPLARGVVKLGQSLQLAALVRWLP